jgi:hypothetical protein
MPTVARSLAFRNETIPPEIFETHADRKINPPGAFSVSPSVQAKTIHDYSLSPLFWKSRIVITRDYNYTT